MHADLHGASSTVIKNHRPDSTIPIPPLTLNQAGCFTVSSNAIFYFYFPFYSFALLEIRFLIQFLCSGTGDVPMSFSCIRTFYASKFLRYLLYRSVTAKRGTQKLLQVPGGYIRIKLVRPPPLESTSQ